METGITAKSCSTGRQLVKYNMFYSCTNITIRISLYNNSSTVHVFFSLIAVLKLSSNDSSPPMTSIARPAASGLSASSARTFATSSRCKVRLTQHHDHLMRLLTEIVISRWVLPILPVFLPSDSVSPPGRRIVQSNPVRCIRFLSASSFHFMYSAIPTHRRSDSFLSASFCEYNNQSSALWTNRCLLEDSRSTRVKASPGF